jgi:hypothetical protein
MLRWARAALLVVGCGHAAPPATPPPTVARVPDAAVADTAPPKLEDDLPRLAERAVGMFQAWQRALAESAEDCAAATAKLNQLALDYADVIEANTHVVKAGRERVKQLRDALAKYDEEMDAAAEAIAHSKTMSKCASDPQFAHAVDRVGGEPP